MIIVSRQTMVAARFLAAAIQDNPALCEAFTAYRVQSGGTPSGVQYLYTMPMYLRDRGLGDEYADVIQAARDLCDNDPDVVAWMPMLAQMILQGEQDQIKVRDA